jgi:YspA, cpYpsA-related SLOG family
MKTVIFGGREFNNYTLMKFIIEETNWYKTGLITHVISGGAGGADALGAKWAREQKLELSVMPAEWSKYGRAAGHLRNGLMADQAELAIGFWNGNSKGTLNMMTLCKNKGIPLLVYRTDKEELLTY